MYILKNKQWSKREGKDYYYLCHGQVNIIVSEDIEKAKVFNTWKKANKAKMTIESFNDSNYEIIEKRLDN